MGKHGGKNKMQTGQASDGNVKQTKVGDKSSKAYDEDTAVFIAMSQELKKEGNKLFQKRDHEGAMLKYEKALTLVPKNHIDVCHLRSNMAACYMQMGFGVYPRAIHECNLALEVTPKYSKALLKRARCYEALNRLELAFRDVNSVLNMEPNNILVLEISERVRSKLERKGLPVNDTVIELPPEYIECASASKISEVVKEKTKKNKKKIDKAEDDKAMDRIEEKKVGENVDEKAAEDKLVVEEKISSKMEEEPKRTVKLI